MAAVAGEKIIRKSKKSFKSSGGFCMQKHVTGFVLAVMLVSMLIGQGFAREVIVEPFINDNLALTIAADADNRASALPEVTTYVLKRNGIYPMVSRIDNEGYFLHIKGEEGDGALPKLVPSPKPDGTYNRFFHFYDDAMFENVDIEMAQPTGGFVVRGFRMYGVGMTLTAKGCYFQHDRGSAISIWADSCTVYVEDCIVNSSGHNKSIQGNGRLIDIRPTIYQKKIVVKNTTCFDITDRIWRNMGTEVDSVEIDHCTFLNVQGYHGGIQLGKTHQASITNNILYNIVIMGSDVRRLQEQTQPENTGMFVVSIDTLYPDADIAIRNNNVWWDQKYLDLWAATDSVNAPGILTPTLKRALGADSSQAYFSEPLTFNNPPPDIYDFVYETLRDPNQLEYPENWYFGNLADINVSYGTSAVSYTGAEGGFPIGDLNFYPDKKAEWEEYLTSVESEKPVGPADFALSQNYPNPFNPETNIAYNINKKANVSLEIFNMLGQKVRTLVNESKTAGSYIVNWDGKNDFGFQVPSGIYFYQLKTNAQTAMKKMIMVK
jgi:hypothetical protein